MSGSEPLLNIFKALFTAFIACPAITSTANAARLARSESRIVDGKNVTPVNKYPMMVSIGLDGNHQFGGSILNKYCILTSAECVEFVQENLERVYVQAGIYFASDPDSRYLQTVAVKSATKHVRYYDVSKGDNANDIGVIRLSRPLVWNDHVAPTNLPTAGWDVLLDKEINAIAVGWGVGRNQSYPCPSTRPLQEVDLPLLTTGTCQQTRSRNSRPFTDHQLCTKFVFPGVCLGDFGGPLFIYNEQDKHVQIGINSLTDEFCGKTTNATYMNIVPVYTHVSKFVHWIEEAIRECNPPRDM